MNEQTIQGNWNQLKGKIQRQWGQLTEDELDEFEGNLDRLVGMIQEKTGQAREMIEDRIASFTGESVGTLESVGDSVSAFAGQATEYAQYAASAVQETACHARETLRDTYHEAEQRVKQHPLEAIALTFAAGLVCGIGATLVLRSK